MVLQRNLDETERVARGAAGIWLLVGAASALRHGRKTAAATLAVAGAGLLFNTATGFCGCNAALGIDASSPSEPLS